MQLVDEHKITNAQFQDAIPLPENRREALRLWLFANRSRFTITSLAALLGVTHGALSQNLGKDRMRVRDHEILVDAGIPAYLLPIPEDVRPGPKPGWKEAMAAEG